MKISKVWKWRHGYRVFIQSKYANDDTFLVHLDDQMNVTSRNEIDEIKDFIKKNRVRILLGAVRG